jgi:hypothetical protein
MNIFTYLMLILITTALIMRALFFTTDLSVFIGSTEEQEEEKLKSKATVFALIWTYPLINFIVASYTISSHWCYDLMIMLHP